MHVTSCDKLIYFELGEKVHAINFIYKNRNGTSSYTRKWLKCAYVLKIYSEPLRIHAKHMFIRKYLKY